MKIIIFFIYGVCLFNMGIQTFAGEVIIVDKKDVKVELTSIETKEIYFRVAKVTYTIPIQNISTISLKEDGTSLILRTITGIELNGNSFSQLEGTWELGKYSIWLSDIKFIDFKRDVNSSKTATMSKESDGFFAIISDSTGMSIEVGSFSFNFQCSYYGVDGNYYKFITKENYLMYLPCQYKEVVVGVPFEKIKEFKYKNNNKELIITLLDERIIKGHLVEWDLYDEFGYNQRFTGKTEFGDVSIPVEDVCQIVFNHQRDKNTDRIEPNKIISENLNSNYIISLETWQGNKITLHNGCQFQVRACTWDDLGTEFYIKIGESWNNVDFNKIKRIQFRKRGTLEGILTTTSGNSIDVSLNDKFWLAGNMDLFETSRIKISEVAWLEISKNVQ